MQKSLSLILVCVSFLLYLMAPMSYSWSYCALCSGIYITNAVIGLLPTIRKEPLSFDLFLSVTIFLCSFVFPLVIYPLDSYYSLFQFGYDRNVMTKCTALVTLAHSVYWLGVKNAAGKNYKKFIVDNITINDKAISLVSKLVLFLFFAFIAVGGLTYYTDRYLDGNMSTNAVFMYLNVFFSSISVTLACMLLYAEKSRQYIKGCILLAAITVIILSTGSRTLPMFLVLPMAYVYQKRYKVSMVQMFFWCVALLFSFIAIGHLRHEVITVDTISTYNMNSSEFGYWDNFIDFIVCNRNLYDIYSYVDNDGILWGKNFLGSILSIVPFAQGIVSSIFCIPTYELDSAYFCTYQVFGARANLGLGTHVVGDVYLATGLVGVIGLFYFLGFFITKLKNGAIITGNRFMYIGYLYMMSYSVFFCRGSFFGAVKGIVWSAVVLYFVNRYYYRR